MQATGAKPWGCVFALNLYDWKDLGVAAPLAGRGCAGFYHLPSGEKVDNGTTEIISQVQLPNYDPLDPFAR
jgi:hypothetical protein